MPFKVLNPPHGISPNEEIDELSSSVNSITLTTRSFYQGLQGSTKGCTATPKSMVNSINSNPRSSYPKLSLEVDLNASLNINMSIAQEKPPPPSVPLRRSKINKSSFIDSNASIISNQDSLQSTSSVSEAKAHTTVKVPLIKKHSKSFISGTIKNKKKSVPQLTPKMPSSPSFLSFSQRWYIIEPEDYTRLGLPSGNWVGTREISFLETREIKRQETIFELISTERDYVRDLQLVVNLFLKPIKDEKLLHIKDIQVLFSNIEQLILINQELLSNLEKRRLEGRCIVPCIADVFLQLSQYFKMYTQYCMNYSDAIHLLKKLSGSKSSFMKWITQTQKQPECKGLDLASFLLKPVQRLCKYPLLLKEILKFTPAFHSDETDLVNALNTLNGVVQKVNEGGKFREEQIKLLELHSKLIWNTHTNGGLPRNPQRRVVSTVNVRKLNKQPRLLILLSDAVLVCKSEWLGSKYLVRHVWLPPIKIIVHGTSGILIEENQVFVFDTLESRDAWLNEWKREENSMELEMDDAWDPLESKNLKDPLSIVDQHSNQMLHHSTALNTAEAELIEEYIKKKVEQID